MKKKNIFIGLLIVVVLLLLSPQIIRLFSNGTDDAPSPCVDIEACMAESELSKQTAEERDALLVKLEEDLDNELKNAEEGTSESSEIQKCQKLMAAAQSNKLTNGGSAACEKAGKDLAADIAKTQEQISQNEEEQKLQQDIIDKNASDEEKRQAEQEKKLLEEQDKELKKKLKEQQEKINLVALLLQIAAIYAYATGNELAGKVLWSAAAELLEKESGSSGGGAGEKSVAEGKLSDDGREKKEELENNGKTIIQAREGTGTLFLSADKTSIDVFDQNKRVAHIPLGDQLTFDADNGITQLNPDYLTGFNGSVCSVRFEQGGELYYVQKVKSTDLGCLSSGNWRVFKNKEVEL